MTQNTQTRKLTGGTLPAPAAEKAGGVDSALDWLWRTLTSMKLALVLMVLFAGIILVGAFVIQMPPGLAEDPRARADWLAGVRPRFGGMTDVLDSLQVFTLFQSVWVKILGALIAASLVACTVARIPGTWRTMKHPHVAVGASFFEHAPQHEAMTFQRTPAEVLETAGQALRRRGYRLTTEDDGVVHLYADKNRWAPWSGLVAHASIVVILAGALVGAQWGFRQDGFNLAEGVTAAVPTVSGATITLNSFQDTYDPRTGQPLDYVSNVTIARDGQAPFTRDVRVNEPLRYEGVSFYQSSFGPAALVSVADADGQAVFAESVPLSMSLIEGGNRVGMFTLPDEGVTVWVVGTNGPSDPRAKPGQVQVQVFDAGTGAGIAQQAIDQGKPATIEGLTFTFEREGKYTGLSVAKDPGTPLVWLGCLLLIGGFAVRLYVPHRRLWGRLEARANGGTALAVAAVGRRDTAFDNEFTSLVTDIRQAVLGQAKS